MSGRDYRDLTFEEVALATSVLFPVDSDVFDEFSIHADKDGVKASVISGDEEVEVKFPWEEVFRALKDEYGEF